MCVCVCVCALLPRSLLQQLQSLQAVLAGKVPKSCRVAGTQTSSCLMVLHCVCVCVCECVRACVCVCVCVREREREKERDRKSVKNSLWLLSEYSPHAPLSGAGLVYVGHAAGCVSGTRLGRTKERREEPATPPPRLCSTLRGE